MSEVGREVAQIIERFQGKHVHHKAKEQNCIKSSANDVLRALLPEIFRRALERAEAIEVPMVIAVANRDGRIIFQYEMDDALLIASEVAPSKAYTAVAMRCKTGDLTARIQPGQPLFQLESMVKRPIVTLGGGFPIYYNDELIGGLGISGGTGSEDVEVGTYALQELVHLQLK
ncbi:MAG: heme-binding protein [Veillonella sp.]|uniref:GlcG/HbpS family heme-binding protein n=1 Tax=Veillonella sp. TaxID=1926307 RepID=UPI0025EAC8A8|nr:heme-binding protein [Veillonella sp.]MBS4913102.1 heme-binding protein [Veillonella sp.]